MTPDQINDAVAEKLGWKKVLFFLVFPDGEVFDENTRPNYFGDLNACRVMRDTLTQKQQQIYLSELCLLEPGHDRFWSMVNASAPQHCEAFLKTHNLWKP